MNASVTDNTTDYFLYNIFLAHLHFIGTQWKITFEYHTQKDEKLLKGIDRPFELRGESRLIRSLITNWIIFISF